MAKRVFLIHGWEGNPENNWFPWLKRELEKKGFEVYAPAMPDADEPKIESWVSELNEVVGTPDEETYFIGHSIGCQAIMRYLEAQLGNLRVGGVIFVAGFFHLPNLESQEEEEIAKPWLETPINTDQIKKMTDNIIAVFSDNDPDVPLSDSEIFEKRLGAKIIIEKEKGHFSDDAGVTELPVVLNEILRISV